ncbi:MAG: N-succinyldiaminopimelate aminotransferase [Gaiellaceae bacterium]|nr:N-succinyldiaminopimelate aminotransferase [Gaiellaceae bacterium]
MPRSGKTALSPARRGSVYAMRLSPVLMRQTTYPFVRLEQAKRAVAARGVELIDFGVGDPREVTDPSIRRALVEHVPERAGYPLAQGLPELREAIAAWADSRFGVALDPEREIIPTLGSKEAIFSFAQIVVDAEHGKDVVVVPDPGYPVYERGALFAHARVETVPLLERNGFLPDLDAVDEELWARIALFWVCYPNNPTGATAPLAFYERLAELAVEHEFLLASDEAYSELYFGEPPASALQVDARENVVVFNTLSKRSSMTGYRSGFVAASEEVIAALRAFRPTVGTAPQEFVQHASVVAWGDEAHVERTRELYRRKRAIFLELFARKGVRVAASEATMYLWVEVPGGGGSEAFAERLLEHGIVVAPGVYLGAAGEGYVRLALVPPEEECMRAAAILESLL